MSKQPKQSKGKAGRKEVLTLTLAEKIVQMISNFPDSGIPVTWNNIIDQVERRFGHRFHRNALSQKSWAGRKRISEAYEDAKQIQSRATRDEAPKYADNSRARLRQVIAKIQSENLALREQLQKLRGQQYDEFFSLLDLRTPLHRAVEEKASMPHASEPKKS